MPPPTQTSNLHPSPIVPSLGELPKRVGTETSTSQRLPVRGPLTAWQPALGSLLLHATALFLLAWWVDDRAPVPAPERPVVTVTLEPIEPAGPTVEDGTAPEPAEPLPDELEALDPSTAQEPIAAPAPDTPALRDPPLAAGLESPVDDLTTEAPPIDRPRVSSPAVDLQQLRQQLSTLSLPDDEDGPAGAAPTFDAPPTTTVPWAQSGERIQGLPLGGGWLNPWVGPVEAYSETWGSIIGERRGVHVLPNGQVICTRVDAPTNDELMNPWMSMRVTYVRLCGRERGTAPPADDLRYAPPPPALRRTPD